MDELDPRVRELFGALEHAGDLAAAGSPLRMGEAGLERDGARVRFMLRLEGARVVAVRYRAYGCPSTLATCEWLARRLEGCELRRLELGNPIDWAQHLGVPAAKMGRLLVIEDALRAALEPEQVHHKSV